MSTVTNNDEKAIEILRQQNGKQTQKKIARMLMRSGVMSKENGPLSGPHVCKLAKEYGVTWMKQKPGKKGPRAPRISKAQANVRNDETDLFIRIISSRLSADAKIAAIKAICVR